MARFSHILVGFLNVFSLLWSIFVILLFSFAIANYPAECNGDNPVLALVYGIFLFSVSLVALIGAIQADRRLLLIYAGVLFACFISLVGFSAFLFLMSKASDAKAAKDHKEYLLNEYPAWLRRYAVDGERWAPIKECMVRQKMCKLLLLEKNTFERGDLRIEKPSILYSCCQPPLHCGFVNKNDTSWEVPKSGIIPSEDPDCLSWRNNLDQVCFDCNSCKAGYIRTLKEKWWRDAQSDAVSSLYMLIGFLIALWAFRQAPTVNIHAADNAAAA